MPWHIMKGLYTYLYLFISYVRHMDCLLTEMGVVSVRMPKTRFAVKGCFRKVIFKSSKNQSHNRMLDEFLVGLSAVLINRSHDPPPVVTATRLSNPTSFRTRIGRSSKQATDDFHSQVNLSGKKNTREPDLLRNFDQFLRMELACPKHRPKIHGERSN